VAVWFIERHGGRIDYLDNWRVRDLRFLEVVAWDFDTLRDWFVGGRREPRPARRGPAAAPQSTPPHPTPPQPTPPQPIWPHSAAPPPPWRPDVSPVARALGYVAVGTVLVLWWLGVLPLGLSLDAADWASLDLDPGAFADVKWPVVKAMIFWPVLAYGAVFILQGAVMLAHPWAVRLQGLVEAVKGLALLAFCVWLWTLSPLASAIAVADVGEFVGRMVTFSETPPLPLEPIATLIVLGSGFTGFVRILRGLWTLAVGGPPAYPDAMAPRGYPNARM
jgi:hypothetical protein